MKKKISKARLAMKKKNSKARLAMKKKNSKARYAKKMTKGEIILEKIVFHLRTFENIAKSIKEESFGREAELIGALEARMRIEQREDAINTYMNPSCLAASNQIEVAVMRAVERINSFEKKIELLISKLEKPDDKIKNI